MAPVDTSAQHSRARWMPLGWDLHYSQIWVEDFELTAYKGISTSPIGLLRAHSHIPHGASCSLRVAYLLKCIPSAPIGQPKYYVCTIAHPTKRSGEALLFVVVSMLDPQMTLSYSYEPSCGRRYVREDQGNPPVTIRMTKFVVYGTRETQANIGHSPTPSIIRSIRTCRGAGICRNPIYQHNEVITSRRRGAFMQWFSCTT